MDPARLQIAWAQSASSLSALHPLRGWRSTWAASNMGVATVFEAATESDARAVLIPVGSGYFHLRATGLFYWSSPRPIHGGTGRGIRRSTELNHTWTSDEREPVLPGALGIEIETTTWRCTLCTERMDLATDAAGAAFCIYPVRDEMEILSEQLWGAFAVFVSRSPVTMQEDREVR